MGRAGKLVFAINETKTEDRRPVRLRSSQTKAGESHVTGVVVTTAITAALLWPAAPFMLLRRGKPIGSPEGTRFDAFVDGEHRLAVMAPSNVVPAAVTPAAQTSLSNEDVVLLVKAGLGDDLIVRKIETSRPAFTTDATDLVQLKQAGVSDRILGAMLQASEGQASDTAPAANAPTPSAPGAPSLRTATVEQRASAPTRREYKTSLPETIAIIVQNGDELTIELTGSGQFAGRQAELRREGNEFSGEGEYQGCSTRWLLKQLQVEVWQATFEDVGCALAGTPASKVGFVLTPLGS